MDAQGRVIGINTAKYWANNIGFAVPVNLALKIATDLAADGRVVRGYMGVRVVPLNRSLNKAMGLRPGMKGVAIDEVEAGSPAAQAGLLPGDVITQVNQLRIDSRSRFYLALAMLRPGDEVPFLVNRKGGLVTLKVKLGSPPDLTKNKRVSRALVPGLVLADLDEGLRNQFSLPAAVEGIVAVKDFGNKDGAPLVRAGEMIVSVNGEETLLLSDLPEEKVLRGKPVMLRIRNKVGERMVSAQDR